jgi:topoisomerase IA-like protein
LETSLHKQQHNQWAVIDANTLARGKDSEGVRYLTKFAKDYFNLFSEALNVGCQKCIRQALTKYNYKIMSTDKDTKAVLKAKYNNISLGFGTGKIVNNDNITQETALRLLELRGEDIFATLPQQKKAETKETPKKTTKKKKSTTK